VHCSAGVGRAGTFVAAASIIERELHVNQQHTPVRNVKRVNGDDDDDDNTNAMFVNDTHRHRSLSEPLDSSAREAVLARSDALFDNSQNNNNNSSTCTHVDDNNDNDNHQPQLVQQRVETVLSRGAGVDFDVYVWIFSQKTFSTCFLICQK